MNDTGRFPMYRRLIAAFCAAILLVVLTAATTSGEQTAPSSTATTPTQTAPAPPPLRNGCKHLYSERYFRFYARMIYAYERVPNKHRRQRVAMLERCQRTAAAQRWSHRARRRISARNRVRRFQLCGSFACNRRLGMAMAVQVYGRGADGCIDYIVSHESGWNPLKWNNGGSGAYGIPQALPGDKMKSAGPRWRFDPRTQIRWMLGYVRKFGGICGAAGYWRLHRSY